jgi:hypothetical protein
MICLIEVKNSTVISEYNTEIKIIMLIDGDSMKLSKIMNNLISITVIDKIINL